MRKIIALAALAPLLTSGTVVVLTVHAQPCDGVPKPKWLLRQR
jgi:hypothetical protein